MSLAKYFLIVASIAATACSKQSPSHDATSSGTALVEQSAADPKQIPIEEYRSHAAPRGIEASYRAMFDNGQILALEEKRRSGEKAEERGGRYEFRGARLMKYQGAALNSDATIQLEFDEHGKVIVSKAGAGPVDAEELSAIRDRAQSLRSHAVANHAVKGHDGA